jgi:hypothetical protein
MGVMWQGLSCEEPLSPAERVSMLPPATSLNFQPFYMMRRVLELMGQRGWKDYIVVNYEENRK